MVFSVDRRTATDNHHKKMNQIKKGDILPCGGIVSYVGPRAYQYRDARGTRHTVETNPITAAEWAEMNESAAIRIAAEKNQEREWNRPLTATEIAASAAADAAAKIARNAERMATGEIILAITGLTLDEVASRHPDAIPPHVTVENGEIAPIYAGAGNGHVWNNLSKTWVFREGGGGPDAGSGYGMNTND
jgi:hypothetical protein